MRRSWFLFVLGDLGIIWISVLLSFYIRFVSDWIPAIEYTGFRLYFESLLIMTPFYLLTLFSLGNYQERHGALNSYEIINLVRSLIFAYLAAISATYLLHIWEHSRVVILLAFLMNTLFCLCFRKIVFTLQAHDWSKGLHLARVLILGTDEKSMLDVAEEIAAHPESGYEVAGTRLIRGAGKFTDVGKVDRIILVGDLAYTEMADTILEFPSSVQMDYIPPYHAFFRGLTPRRRIASMPAIHLNGQVLSDWSAFSKRLMDVLVSGCLLLLFAPVMLIIALCIKLSYGAPVLFRQERVGKNGRVFVIIKFRTMKPDSDKQTSEIIQSGKQAGFKWKDDPRVENQFARFLRKTGMDELPQLWNVLSGRMSLVGPRPATPELVRNYSPEHKIRLAIPPGLTGLQQVNCRGTASIQEILAFDIQYIQHQSLWLDTVILMKTLHTVISGKGTP